MVPLEGKHRQKDPEIPGEELALFVFNFAKEREGRREGRKVVIVKSAVYKTTVHGDRVLFHFFKLDAVLL